MGGRREQVGIATEGDGDPQREKHICIDADGRE
jgi:hypothetical protein